MIKKILVTAAIGTFLLTSTAQAGTVAQWDRDIDQIVTDIGSLHPHPWRNVGRSDFMRHAEALKAELPHLSEEARVARAMQLVALVDDRATSLEPDASASNTWYPIRVYQFSDGYFITAAHRSVGDLAGAQVLSIGGRPVEEAVHLARSLLASNSEHESAERLFALDDVALMRGVGLADADGKLHLQVRLRSGNVASRVLTGEAANDPDFAGANSIFIWADRTETYGTPLDSLNDWVSAYHGLHSIAFREADDTRPLHLRQRRVFYAKALPAQDAYYAQINYMSNSAQEDFDDFFRRMMREVDAAHPRRLIIDLRYNSGGDGSHGVMMAQEIIRRSANPPWHELYVLVGRRTAGAAISGVDALVRNTPTTLVGEPTGGYYNQSSDAQAFDFPDTHLRLTVAIASAQMSQSNDLSNTIVPDVPAMFSFADWSAGRDPAIDPILAGQEMRSTGVVALMDGGAAARAADVRRRGAYARVAWWRPTSFIDVKTVGYDLLRANRAGDAAEMFTLMAELYPTDWNSWESLGRAQTAQNDLAGARASYRCALLQDPQNFDAPDLHAAIAAAPTERGFPRGCPGV